MTTPPTEPLLPDDFDDAEFYDLMQASESSLDFWDNPFDDEDWNCSTVATTP